MRGPLPTEAQVPSSTGRDMIAALGLEPHPEGGWYRETWRGPDGPDGRPTGTAIYYLLGRSERSAWHRIDADEIWHHCAGAPLELRIARSEDAAERVVLGDDEGRGGRPQALVPARAWQTARSLGEWTLVGCTAVPGFTFEGFELAPPGWEPGEPGELDTSNTHSRF